MLFLNQQLIQPFLCHKSANTCQIGSNKVSDSKLKPVLCNCVKREITESVASPQHPHKRSTILLRHPI